MDNRLKLKILLSVANHEEYDDDAVRALLNRDPAAARGCDYQPLHSALEFGASATTVGLLCEACPDSVKEKDDDGFTPLHLACGLDDGLGPSLDVVKYLVDKRPEALAEKTSDGQTPLAVACTNEKACYEVTKFLIEKHADAVKEKDSEGWFPLHAAFWSGLSLEVVTMLVTIFPKAIEIKTEDSRDVPLHLACECGKSLEAVKQLIERFPTALQMQNAKNQTPLECAKQQGHASPEIVDLLSTLHSLTNLAENDPNIITILRRFQDMHWPGGVALVLDSFPSVVNTIDHSLFPTILSLVGRRCSLSTFYAMLQDNPTLVKGAVRTKKDKQRAEEPPTKRIKK